MRGWRVAKASRQGAFQFSRHCNRSIAATRAVVRPWVAARQRRTTSNAILPGSQTGGHIPGTEHGAIATDRRSHRCKRGSLPCRTSQPAREYRAFRRNTQPRQKQGTELNMRCTAAASVPLEFRYSTRSEANGGRTTALNHQRAARSKRESEGHLESCLLEKIDSLRAHEPTWENPSIRRTTKPAISCRRDGLEVASARRWCYG